MWSVVNTAPDIETALLSLKQPIWGNNKMVGFTIDGSNELESYIDKAGKACQWQTLYLTKPNCKLQRKWSVVNMAPDIETALLSLKQPIWGNNKLVGFTTGGSNKLEYYIAQGWKACQWQKL
jgi:hypothetical protein